MNFHLLQRCRYLMVGMLSVHYEERDQSYLHTLIVKVRGWAHYRHHAYITTATHMYMYVCMHTRQGGNLNKIIQLSCCYV